MIDVDQAKADRLEILKVNHPEASSDSNCAICFLLSEIKSRDTKIAQMEEEDSKKVFIDTAFPEGWIWTLKKFHNHPWADCGYAEARSPYEEPTYKAYGHTPSEAFRGVLNQILAEGPSEDVR